MSFQRELEDYGPDLDFSENATFCLYCGTELGVVISDDRRIGANTCLACSTQWEQCYTSRCPSCGPHGGWVHLNKPYCATFTSSGRFRTAYGTGACDCCLTAVVWAWYRRSDGLFDEPLLKLACIDHADPMPQVSHVEGRVHEIVQHTS
jgi:hypothetical protein